MTAKQIAKKRSCVAGGGDQCRPQGATSASDVSEDEACRQCAYFSRTAQERSPASIEMLLHSEPQGPVEGKLVW